MWREKYNLENDDEDDLQPQIIQPPLEAPTEPGLYPNPEGSGQWPPDRDFEISMHFTIVRDNGERVHAILPLVADPYNIGAFVEVLHYNGIPYAVVPIDGDGEPGEPEEPKEEEDDEE